MAAHAIASGTISFGLVTVPVKLYTATKSPARPVEGWDVRRLGEHAAAEVAA